MKYPVKITQVLEGIVEIEAQSRDEALRQAEELYSRQGRELPDMEDVNPLRYTHADDPEISPLFAFIEQEVPFRLENVLGIDDVPQEVVSAVIESLKDENDVMFDYDRLDEFISDKYEELMADRGQDLSAPSQERNTLISFLYRDASNYKVHNQCVISGLLTEDQQKAILSCLDEGEYFIPSQVGLPEQRFDDYDEQEDHPWFELGPYSFEETSYPANVNLTAAELVQAFKDCRDNWDEVRLYTKQPTNQELYFVLADKLEDAISAGEYETWEDLCVEHPIQADYDPVAGAFRPGYGLVVWGEETDAGEKYFSVSVHKLDSNLEPYEKVLTAFTDSTEFSDLETAVYSVLRQLNAYKSTHPVFVNCPVEFSLSAGPVKLEWVDAEEGRHGDYNPDDPNDISLLRFEVSVLRNGRWTEKEDASYCTNFPVDSTLEQRKQGLEILFREFYDALHSDVEVSVKKLGERLSYIGLDDLPKPKVEHVPLNSLISSAQNRQAEQAGGQKAPPPEPER